MRRYGDRSGSALGIAVTAIAAFAVGAMAGMVLGGSVGAVHGQRVRDTLDRVRGARRPMPAREVERAVRAALREDEATRDLDVDVHVADNGLVELTGVVSDAMVRRAAADVARAVPGVTVVVNRVLVRPNEPPQPAPARRST